MRSHRVGDGERSLAVFIDFENMGLGFNNSREKFEINKVLERLVEKGKIVAKKAYADWSRFGNYTTELHEAAIELVEIPRRGVSGKNSADIRLVVDAMDLAYSKDHIDTFVIVSGDSDFSPLVSKLKELGKHVIGLGLADATSDLLRDNCDEFIYYEDLDRAPIIPVSLNEQIPEKKRKVFSLLLDSLVALRRENKEVIYSSMLKDTIKRKKPSFNEEYYGYRTFSELLEDAQRWGLLEIEKHKSSGMYVVTRFGLEMKGGGPATGTQARNGSSGSRSAEPARSAGGSTRSSCGERGERVATGPSRSAGRGGDKPAPAPPPPPPRPVLEPLDEPAAPYDRPLGRALVEEIADWDEFEEAPVAAQGRAEKPAGPAAATPPPAAAPARPAAASPSRTTAPPAAKPAAASAAKPTTTAPATPPAARPTTPKAPPPPTAKKSDQASSPRATAGEKSSAGTKDNSSPPSRPAPASRRKTTRPPEPTPGLQTSPPHDEADEFAAGLD